MAQASGSPLIQLQQLQKTFALRRRLVRAVDDVTLAVQGGEIVGLVGESGSGKSTLGELVLRLQRPTGGKVLYRGQDVFTLHGAALRAFRSSVQMVFQDPYQTLNPRFTVRAAVAEPLVIHRVPHSEHYGRVLEALELAELRPAEHFLGRYPHELSGGQRQRLALARAIVLGPQFLVADEPVSMLDVSVRAGVLNVLKRLRDRLGLAILYISHDLTTVNYLCDRVAVMYLGQIVEIGPTRSVIDRPQHPYTQALISSILVPGRRGRRLVEVSDRAADPFNLVIGCRFAPRCPEAFDRCWGEMPRLELVGPVGHLAACWARFQGARDSPSAHPAIPRIAGS